MSASKSEMDKIFSDYLSDHKPFQHGEILSWNITNIFRAIMGGKSFNNGFGGTEDDPAYDIRLEKIVNALVDIISRNPHINVACLQEVPCAANDPQIKKSGAEQKFIQKLKAAIKAKLQDDFELTDVKPTAGTSSGLLTLVRKSAYSISPSPTTGQTDRFQAWTQAGRAQCLELTDKTPGKNKKGLINGHLAWPGLPGEGMRPTVQCDIIELLHKGYTIVADFNASLAPVLKVIDDFDRQTKSSGDPKKREQIILDSAEVPQDNNVVFRAGAPNNRYSASVDAILIPNLSWARTPEAHAALMQKLQNSFPNIKRLSSQVPKGAELVGPSKRIILNLSGQPMAQKTLEREQVENSNWDATLRDLDLDSYLTLMVGAGFYREISNPSYGAAPPSQSKTAADAAADAKAAAAAAAAPAAGAAAAKPAAGAAAAAAAAASATPLPPLPPPPPVRFRPPAPSAPSTAGVGGATPGDVKGASETLSLINVQYPNRDPKTGFADPNDPVYLFYANRKQAEHDAQILLRHGISGSGSNGAKAVTGTDGSGVIYIDLKLSEFMNFGEEVIKNESRLPRPLRIDSSPRRGLNYPVFSTKSNAEIWTMLLMKDPFNITGPGGKPRTVNVNPNGESSFGLDNLELAKLLSLNLPLEPLATAPVKSKPPHG